MCTTMYNMWRKSNVKLQNSQLFKITIKWGHVAPCKVCIEELNSLPVVRQSLQEQLKTGIKSLFNKEEQRKVISGVCLVNRVAYDVTQTVSQKEPLPQWLMIDTGKEKFDLLRDRRVTKILCKEGMENCSVSWILGHNGKEEHGLNNPSGGQLKRALYFKRLWLDNQGV